MKVSGSILAVKDNYLSYAKQLKLAGVDFLHIDIFQDSPNYTVEDLMDFDDNFLPLDVHLIFEKITDDDIKILNKTNIMYLNIQYETLIDKQLIHSLSKKIDARVGIAITVDTPLSVVEEFKNSISQVLFMCSKPGISGAKFDELNYERIREAKERYPSLYLCADGGIDSNIARKMGLLGISLIVSGSFLSKDISELTSNTYFLKYLNERNINVKRLMIPVGELPLCGKNDGFMEIIMKMSKYRLGMVFVVEHDMLKGIISDGDVRRGFIKYQRDLFDMRAQDYMNTEPFFTNGEETMDRIYDKISLKKRGISIIPVIEDKKLIGAIDLHMGM